jgi:tryptophanyl-tRNA synthetase
MGLDGSAKMSKSMNNYIALEETPDSLMQKLRSAKTDENRIRRSDPGNPDICNIYHLHKVFSPKEEVEMVNLECRRAGIGCVDCKKMLYKRLLDFMEPIQEKIAHYRNNLGKVEEILRAGASHTGEIARQSMEEVREKMGLKVF